MLRVLTIAGSDSGGGAGLQADLKVFAALDAYGMSVVTAVTAQNTQGVLGYEPVSTILVRQQLEAVLKDIGAEAAKTGMLANSEIIQTLAEVLRKRPIPILVVDPVLVAKGGARLLAKEAEKILKKEILPLATVITPNIPEAEALVGSKIRSPAEMAEAARKIKKKGPQAVIIKGGHLEEDPVDILFDGAEIFELPGRRLPGPIGHGTGCTFSAALTVYLARGNSLFEAARKAKEFVTMALKASPQIGHGVAPTDPLIWPRRKGERFEVIKRLSLAGELLTKIPARPLVPEVQINIGYALPFARTPDEVAAFPGRIVGFKETVRIVAPPEFGASRHVANIILTVMKYDPEYRAAMNIRYQEDFISRARKMGLKVAEFSRAKEPPEIKEKEGSSLSWGVAWAIEKLEAIPDLVYDKGDVGKEPMIRLLGQDPLDLVSLALRLANLNQA
ncbi:bifunctional hydroxymethylpyrimidine kinase/phosphomethylpyrimidine kinase [Thermosulfuriphilus sp.]